jgi:hypothetical protein
MSVRKATIATGTKLNRHRRSGIPHYGLDLDLRDVRGTEVSLCYALV